MVPELHVERGNGQAVAEVSEMIQNRVPISGPRTDDSTDANAVRHPPDTASGMSRPPRRQPPVGSSPPSHRQLPDPVASRPVEGELGVEHRVVGLQNIGEKYGEVLVDVQFVRHRWARLQLEAIREIVVVAGYAEWGAGEGELSAVGRPRWRDGDGVLAVADVVLPRSRRR